jgi:hypothetical protein
MIQIVTSFKATLTSAGSATTGEDNPIHNFAMHETKPESQSDKDFLIQSKAELNKRLTSVVDEMYPKPSIPSKNEHESSGSGGDQ